MKERDLVAALAGAVALSAAVAMAPAPTPPPEGRAALPPAPSASVLEAAALWRREAAADAIWLRVVQFVGDPRSEAVAYAGLGPWIRVINELAPRFELPYYVGGILLATSPDGADEATAILSSLEQALVPTRCREPPEGCRPLPPELDPEAVDEVCVECPALEGCEWEVPLWHAFALYFGKLDPNGAARFYCEARRRGGPAYLTSFTRRLAGEVTTCVDLRRNLGRLLNSTRGDHRAGVLRSKAQQLRVVVHCEELAIKRAVGAFRLRVGRDPHTVEELLESGLLATPPFTPPGECWRIEAGQGKLGPCPSPSPGSTQE